jgi:hypothetical protein
MTGADFYSAEVREVRTIDDAVEEGELDVCRWIHELEELKGDILDHSLYRALASGHIHIAKWLLELGATLSPTVLIRNMAYNIAMAAPGFMRVRLFDAITWFLKNHAPEDVIFTRDERGNTAMFNAVYFALGGTNFEFAQFLLERGVRFDEEQWLSEGGYVANRGTVLRAIGSDSSTQWVLQGIRWLVLNGAACGPNGHIDGAIIERDVSGSILPKCDLTTRGEKASRAAQAYRYSSPSNNRLGLFESLRADLDQHFVFTGLILATAHFDQRHPLACLDTPSIMKDIADYAGVVYGRPLRNAREVVRFFDDSKPLAELNQVRAKALAAKRQEEESFRELKRLMEQLEADRALNAAAEKALVDAEAVFRM